MEVKVENYGLAEKIDSDDKEMAFVTYKVSGLDSSSLDFLKENLYIDNKIYNDVLIIKIFYD